MFNFSIHEVELSDPPVYSEDRRFIKSKDGMCWVAVAPHAAAGAPVNVEVGTCNVAMASGVWAGAAPAPIGNWQTFTTGWPQAMPTPEVSKAFNLFYKNDLTPDETELKIKIEELIKQHNLSKVSS